MPGKSHQLYRRSGATRITPGKWLAVRSALADAGGRFEALVANADPRAMATTEWTVLDAAMHVTAIALPPARIPPERAAGSAALGSR